VGVHLEAKARVLVTTPAAGKVYRNGGVRLATAQRHRLTVEAGGSLEWLPQETIVFDGAHVELETRVDLEADAVFVGWEILCLGRPAAGESFSQGRCRQRLELWRDGRPLCIERASVDGGGPLLTAAWGLRGAPVTGTMLATMPATSPAAAAGTDEALAALRALAGALPSGELGSVTRIGEVLVGRYLGASAERARELFGGIWRTVRGQVVGRPASAPRVWDHRLAI
jgi:urease accessory protein